MNSRPAPVADDECLALFRSGMGPRRAGDAAGGGRTITTLFSPWLGLRCATCWQTFRAGDPVTVTDDDVLDVKHLNPQLHCAGRGEPAGSPGDAESAPHAEMSADAEVLAFTAALLAVQTPGDPDVAILSARDWQVARRGEATAPQCLICGHTFRAGDAVIICPCAHQTDRPPLPGCALTVHRDPAAGLDCWGMWRQDGPLSRCPVVHDRLPASRPTS